MAEKRDEQRSERTIVVPEITFSWTSTLGYGLFAGVGTYAAVVLLLTIQVATLTTGTVGGVGTRSFAFGTLGDFYGSHLGVVSGVELGVASVGTVPPFVYYLVSPVLLTWAGRRCAVTTGAKDVQEAILQGASVTAGYAMVVFFGLSILGGAAGFELVGVDPLRTALVAGLLYPIVFGGLGGYTTRATRDNLP